MLQPMAQLAVGCNIHSENTQRNEMKDQTTQTAAKDKTDFERRLTELQRKRQAAWENLRAQTQAELQVWSAELEKLKAEAAAKQARLSADGHRQAEAQLAELEAIVKDLRRKATRASFESTLELERRLTELYDKRRALSEKLRPRK
jgi:transketolase